MNLQRILPASVLKYYWVDPKNTPYSVIRRRGPRDSRQGWVQLGNPGAECPTGAQVAAAGLQVDATRGIVQIATPWGAAIGATWTSLTIAVWKSTEAAPPIYDPANPVNAAAGRLGLSVAAGDSAATVAIGIVAAISTMLAATPAEALKFIELGGGLQANNARADLGAGSVVIVSPRLWVASTFMQVTGAFLINPAFGRLYATQVIAHDAAIVPILTAGVRPAPWQIVGTATTGQGTAVPLRPPEAVPLLTAGNYAILAKSGITNIPTSDVTGDMGISPAAASNITGLSLVLDGGGQFSTSAQVTGDVLAADYVAPTPATLTQAVLDMQAAYTNAAGRAPDFTEFHAGLLNGETLVPGVYKWSTGVSISGDITLHGASGDIFIFEIAGVLSLAASKKVLLTGGVLPANVFWQVAGNVALGAGTTFAGTILCLTDITIGAGSTMVGRCLAQTAVNLASVTLN